MTAKKMKTVFEINHNID